MAMAAFSPQPTKLLLYSEVEDGVTSADLFAEIEGKSKIVFRFAPSDLRERIYAFWESGDGVVQPRSWAVFKMLVENFRFNVDLAYPSDLIDGEDLSDRRPRIVAQAFPRRMVDYSKQGRG